MRRSTLGWVMVGMVVSLLVCDRLEAQRLPDKSVILEQMTRANRYFLDKWPDPGAPIVKDKVRPANIWTRSTYFEGLMALYALDPRPEYYDYMVQWGQAHNWAPAYNDPNTRNADDQCCGQTYIDLYLLDPRPERIQTIKGCVDRMVHSSKRDDWWWIDALQMAMPIFARLGVVTGDPAYFQALYEFYLFTKTRHGDRGLYNPEDHLWWRDADFDPPTTSPNGEDCYWSRGNGWVLAALTRCLEVLPEDAVGRDDYLRTYRQMCAALVPIQRADGFWNVSLHDPNEYGGPELSGTAFFTYAMAWGLRQGILDERTYGPVVRRAWHAMSTRSLHANGFLGYVQGTGKEPASSQPVGYDIVPNFEDYGLGAFLLAGSEVYKLALSQERRADVQVALEAMRRANDYFMRRWPDPGQDIVTNRRRPSNIWTRATYYEGLLALYGIDRRPAYYDYAVRWGQSHRWGLRGGDSTRNADNQCCGQTYIDLYLMDPQPERLASIQASISAMVASDPCDDWHWIDALQMAMPVFSRLGMITHDRRFFDKMYELYRFTKTGHGDHGLYNPQDHLWWRDADYDPPTTAPNGEDCYWSRGNGWVITALARVLEDLPADAPGVDDYRQTFQDMAEALRQVQRPDGFWPVSLHDPNHFPGKESSGTAFFTYALAWGVNRGLLDARTFRPVALKGWNALILDALRPDGFLRYVQATGKDPAAGQPVTWASRPDFEDYGLGAFLLAGAEVIKMGR